MSDRPPSYDEFIVPNHSSYLEDKLELSAALGVYISTFTQVEFATTNLFAWMMRTDSGVAQLILHEFASYAKRLDVIARLATHLAHISTDDRDVITGITNNMKEEAKFRNRLAHSMYAGKSGEDTVYTVENATRVQAPRVMPISGDDIQQGICRLATIHARLDRYRPQPPIPQS